ncbi:MAG: hypothetical protein AAF483_01715 [Planctomycetota bacterium]
MNQEKVMNPDSKMQLPLLQNIGIASPCNADWEAMEGDDQKRFCQQCSLHVYNLSEMSALEAESFLQSELGEGKRVCTRLFRRKDGKILTKNCPVGIRAMRARVFKAAAAMVAFICSGLAMAAGGTRLGKWAESRGAMIQEPTYPEMGDVCFTPAMVPPAAPATGSTYAAQEVPFELPDSSLSN